MESFSSHIILRPLQKYISVTLYYNYVYNIIIIITSNICLFFQHRRLIFRATTEQRYSRLGQVCEIELRGDR